GRFWRFSFFLFAFSDRHRFLFLLRDIGLVGLKFGIELLPPNGLEFLRNRRGGAGAPRFQKRLRVIGCATVRADHGVAQQIGVTGPAARTNSLGAPLGFGHHSLHRGFAKSVRRALPQRRRPVKSKPKTNYPGSGRRVAAYGHTLTRPQLSNLISEPPPWPTTSPSNRLSP